MESYTLPKELQEDLGVPKHLPKCFRDEDDLSGTKLQEAIYKELKKSKYMIVVCSKNTPKSFYVNEEVKMFCEVRGKEFIIPFIIDGEPDATEKEDSCYPQALIDAYSGEDSPLGYDIRQLGKWKVISKIVATLLGLSADFLLKRDQRRRKKLIIRNSIAAAIGSAAAIYVLSFIIYCLPSKAYYVDYVMQWGVPVGIGELTNKEVALKSSHYCIITTKKAEGFFFWNGSVTYDIRYENSVGTLIEESSKVDQASWITCTFSNDGQYTMLLRDEHEREYATLKYSKDMLAMDITDPEVDSQAIVLAADMTSSAFETGDDFMSYGNISRKYYTYDENGYVIRVEYMSDNRNTPIADINGIYGEEYVLDEKGRIIETYYLNEEGERFSAGTGVYCTMTVYNDDNRVVTEYAYTESGEMTYPINKTVITVREYDENLNSIMVSYTDLDGNAKNCEDAYAAVGGTYENGFLVLEEYYSTDGSPACYSYDRSSVAWTYDEDGRAIREIYYEADGITISTEFYSMKSVEYDEKGYVTKLSVLDESGELYQDSSFFASIEYEYDEDGNVVRRIYRDAEGNLYSTYAIYEFTYESNVLKVVTYDSEGEFSLAAEYIMDSATGNLIEVRCCDQEWNLAPGYIDDYSIHTYEYDESGHVSRISYYDENEELLDAYNYGFESTLFESGLDGFCTYASIEITYDSVGNVVEQRCYTADGELRTDAFAICKMTYDDYHNMLSQEYYDENEEPAYYDSYPYDYTKVCYEYDANGYVTKEEYYESVEDSPICINVYTYDQWGNCTTEKNYDENGELEVSYKGYAYIEYVYNASGEIVEETYYDENNQIIFIEDNYYGSYAKVVKDYENSSCSYPSKISYYDADGNAIMIEPSGMTGYSSVEYDNISSYNTYTEVRYYDEEGALLLVSEGENSYDWDEDGNMVRILDVYSQYARITYTYDEEQQLLEEQYFDTEGNLINQGDGYARIQYEYSESSSDYTMRYYDEDGELILYQGLYASVEREYDLEFTWQVSEESYYDLEGDLCCNEDGYAVVSYKYAAYGSSYYGNCIETAYYDENEELVDVTTNYGTYAKLVKEYVEDSYQCILEAYYDANGELCLQEDGYAIVRYEYNEDGRCTKTSYYGEDDEPILMEDYNKTYFSIEKEYLEGSYYVRYETYYGVDGNLAEIPYSSWYSDITYSSRETLYYNNSSYGYKYYDSNGEEVIIGN